MRYHRRLFTFSDDNLCKVRSALMPRSNWLAESLANSLVCWVFWRADRLTFSPRLGSIELEAVFLDKLWKPFCKYPGDELAFEKAPLRCADGLILSVILSSLIVTILGQASCLCFLIYNLIMGLVRFCIPWGEWSHILFLNKLLRI